MTAAAEMPFFRQNANSRFPRYINLSVRREDVCVSAGVSPAWEWSLCPVAIEAAVEVTKLSEPSMERAV